MDFCQIKYLTDSVEIGSFAWTKKHVVMKPHYLFFQGKLWILTIMCCLSALATLGQNRPYFPFFQQEYFFGLHPSARSEAMGRTDVAMGGAISSAYYNPAGIGFIEDWEATVSTSGPYYALQNSDYLFTGYARRWRSRWVAGINIHQFGTGPSPFQVNIAGERFDLDRPVVNDLALTVAGEVLPGLYVGVNGHFFIWKIFPDVPAACAFYADAGALYKITQGDRKISVGAGFVNLTGTEISFSSPINTSSSNFFPMILRVGGAYENKVQLTLPGLGAQTIQYTATLERQDLINNAFRKAWRVGGEAILFDALAIRLGAFTQTEDDMGISTNRSRIFDVTYGFGLILPVYKWWNGDLPFTVHMDYYALENPPLTTNSRRFSNKRGFMVRVVSTLDK